MGLAGVASERLVRGGALLVIGVGVLHVAARMLPRRNAVMAALPGVVITSAARSTSSRASTGRIVE